MCTFPKHLIERPNEFKQSNNIVLNENQNEQWITIDVVLKIIWT